MPGFSAQAHPMVKVNISADFAHGKPLTELAKLVNARMVYLGETARYSVGAIAINALKSMKKNTRRYKGRGKVSVANV